MKITRSKGFLTLASVFFILALSSFAKSPINFPALVKVITFSGTRYPGDVAPASVVVYPANLQDYRKQTKDYVKAFSKKERENIIRILSKGKNFFPKALAVFAKYNVPQELQMIPVLESAFNANAVSPVGAVGHWQFMATLAKEYGLRTGGKYDERRNFGKASVAAAKFFRDQLDYFDEDLLLSVAAYNCGQGRVRSSIRKCGKACATYWDVKKYLPSETRKFVMKFIALNVIFSNYENFLAKELNFNDPPVIAAPPVPDSPVPVADSPVVQESVSSAAL
jgi:hypothetical protein